MQRPTTTTQSNGNNMIGQRSTPQVRANVRELTREKCLSWVIRTTTALFFLTLVILLVQSAANAQTPSYEEGVQYEVLSKPQPVSTGDKIEVRELFWYGCPHCFEFEPHIQRWQQNMPENAEYVPMPALFRKDWEFHARVYYTFEALGMVDKLHVPFFEALHKDRKTIQSLDELIEFTNDFDIDPELVRETYNSFAVETKTRQSKASLPGYQVTGVPAIIVDGKYRTSGAQAGDYEELLNVIDFLVDKSASER